MATRRITKQDVMLEQFYQLPKFLWNSDFIDLNSDARILYSLLRDRHGLSLANGWVNNKGEVFLIYTRDEMAFMLGVTLPTTRKAIKKLIESGLMEDVFQGLNKPNLIYLCTVSPHKQRTERIFHSRKKEYFTQDRKNLSPNKTDDIDTDNNKTENIHRSMNDGHIHKLIEDYCRIRFDRVVRYSKSYIELEIIEDMEREELTGFLDENIKSYDQCNLDYIKSIQGRAL